jgi:hypothetical protein
MPVHAPVAPEPALANATPRLILGKFPKEIKDFSHTTRKNHGNISCSPNTLYDTASNLRNIRQFNN